MSVSVIPDRDGAWVAVVAGESVLVIEAQAAAGIAPLHAALRSDDPTRAVLGLLLAARGLDELPPFALVWLAGAGAEARTTVRVVLRGPLTVTSGSEALSGSGVETWTERSMTAERELRISTPAEASGAALPLVDGAAWAAQVTVEIAAGAVDAAPGAVEAPEVPVDAAEAPVEAPVEAPGVPVDVAEAAAAPASAPAAIDERTMAEPQDDPLGYDELFGATVLRTVEDAAVRPLAASEDAEPPAAHDIGSLDDGGDGGDDDDDGDHDGLTVFSDHLGDVHGRVRPHPSEIAAADAPASFWIRMPDGNRERVIGEVLVGRAPTTRMGDGPVPRLVTLAGDPDISRTHVKFALEGDTVVVTDLHSRNGTTVVLPGKPPQLLRKGESATVIADTVVDLGGGTHMTVEQDAS